MPQTGHLCHNGDDGGDVGGDDGGNDGGHDSDPYGTPLNNRMISFSRS